MCSRRRQQRTLIATALLAGLHEYQAHKKRSLPPSQTNGTTSFQEPMTQGITYMAPQYTETVDPNPPGYEEATSNSPVREINLADEKREIYRLSTEEQVPPHEFENYDRNTGLDSAVPRSMPPLITVTSPSRTSDVPPPQTQNNETLSHLLEAISLYFDTQVKLNASNPAAVRKLEFKKAKKLAKAEKKYKEYVAKGKDSKNAQKMEKRAEKMEKWTEWVLQKSVDHHEKHMERRHRGRRCGSVAEEMAQRRGEMIERRGGRGIRV